MLNRKGAISFSDAVGDESSEVVPALIESFLSGFECPLNASTESRSPCNIQEATLG